MGCSFYRIPSGARTKALWKWIAVKISSVRLLLNDVSFFICKLATEGTSSKVFSMFFKYRFRSLGSIQSLEYSESELLYHTFKNHFSSSSYQRVFKTKGKLFSNFTRNHNNKNVLKHEIPDTHHRFFFPNIYLCKSTSRHTHEPFCFIF